MKKYFIFDLFKFFKLFNIGRLAEWLGIGLQNRVRRFESATDLNENLHRKAVEVFGFQTEPWAHERGKKIKNLHSLRSRLKV